MRCELYSISFPNGKLYIGISRNSKMRFKQHLKTARRKLGSKMQSAIRKYGRANMVLTILCIGDIDYIKALEVKAIAAFNTRNDDFGYNISMGGDHYRLGCKNSPEAIAKTVAANTGRKNSPETLAKMRFAALRRDPPTPETCRKISEAKTGRRMSGEVRKRQSIMQMGRKHSPETLIKMCAAQKLAWKKRRDDA